MYLQIAASTLRWWFFGRRQTGKQKGYDPIFHADLNSGLLSFYNLVEAHILSSLKVDYVQNNVRRALEYVKKQSPEKVHPLVTERFHTDGKDLFLRIVNEDTGAQSLTINATIGGQGHMLDQYLALIDYDKGFAAKLFPMYGGRVIVLNPSVSAGRPIIAGTGVLATIVRQRANAGESIEDLARDYKTSRSEIEKAIHFVEKIAA